MTCVGSLHRGRPAGSISWEEWQVMEYLLKEGCSSEWKRVRSLHCMPKSVQQGVLFSTCSIVDITNFPDSCEPEGIVPVALSHVAWSRRPSANGAQIVPSCGHNNPGQGFDVRQLDVTLPSSRNPRVAFSISMFCSIVVLIVITTQDGPLALPADASWQMNALELGHTTCLRNTLH